jgi:endonuclease/exonuclease/phosphatase family metal-dependent hydrolase
VAQASIVRRHYLEALNNGEHVIVAGDLNDKRGDPAIRRIRGRDDIYGDLIQTGRPEFFEDTDLDTRWTYEYEGVRQQIDHILISDSVLRSCKSGGVKAKTVPFDNPLVSDHRALVVKLTFKPN